jgi:hypothetical protein
MPGGYGHKSKSQKVALCLRELRRANARAAMMPVTSIIHTEGSDTPKTTITCIPGAKLGREAKSLKSQLLRVRRRELISNYVPIICNRILICACSASFPVLPHHVVKHASSSFHADYATGRSPRTVPGAY